MHASWGYLQRLTADATLSLSSCVCTTTGFLLFVGLAFYVYSHPPTPLAVTADHLDGLWHELSADFQSLHLGDKAHALTHTLTDSVAALEGRLTHALSDNLHSIQDSLHSNPLLHAVSGSMHTVGHALSDNLHSLQGSLQHGLHAVESQLQSSAAHIGSNIAGRASVLQTVLKQQLRPIVQWPTPRWPVSWLRVVTWVGWTRTHSLLGGLAAVVVYHL